MAAIDFPGARLRLYLVRCLQHAEQHPDAVVSAEDEPLYQRGAFIGIYRDYTPEAALLTAKEDNPAPFQRGPVAVTDLSAWARLVSYEATLALTLIHFPNGHMQRSHLHVGHPLIKLAQKPFTMKTA